MNEQDEVNDLFPYQVDLIDVEAGVESTDCTQFDLKTIEDATNGFSPLNKLGEGGFGIVYKVINY